MSQKGHLLALKDLKKHIKNSYIFVFFVNLSPIRINSEKIFSYSGIISEIALGFR